MKVLAEFGSGQVFWSMLWFFLFFIWIWLLITVFADIFRSPDMGGGAKALWTIFVIVLPYLGVFVYLIARGHKMQEHAVAQAQAQDEAARQYIQSVAGGSHERGRRDRPPCGPAGQGSHHRGGVPGSQGQGAGLAGRRSALPGAGGPRSAEDRAVRGIKGSSRVRPVVNAAAGGAYGPHERREAA